MANSTCQCNIVAQMTMWLISSPNKWAKYLFIKHKITLGMEELPLKGKIDYCQTSICLLPFPLCLYHCSNYGLHEVYSYAFFTLLDKVYLQKLKTSDCSKQKIAFYWKAEAHARGNGRLEASTVEGGSNNDSNSAVRSDGSRGIFEQRFGCFRACTNIIPKPSGQQWDIGMSWTSI